MSIPDGAEDAGRLIAGRFRVTDVIARGGMAMVYRAHDERLGRDVAVKVVDLRVDLDGRSQQRSTLEAKRAASLRHPNIVSVHDAGTDGERAFIVMELVEGEPLGDLLEEGGVLPEREAASIGVQVCRALAEAHRRGIVHRDIKPSNVLVDADGRAQVADFGIARGHDGDTITEHHPMGSAPYIAPEQLSGQEVDGRADLYGLGILLYEAVTGRLPFAGDTSTATAWQRLHRRPEPPDSHVDLPGGLGRVIERALETDPDDRYQTADEMRLDLERVAGSADEDTAALPVMSPPRRRRSWLVAAALFAAAAVSGGLFALRTGTFESTAATDAVVPDVTGVDLDAAERLLRIQDLTIGNAERVPSDAPVGTVVAQQPPQGAEVAPGSSVDVTISAGDIDTRATTPTTVPRAVEEETESDVGGSAESDAASPEEPTEPTEPTSQGRRDEPPGHGTPPGHTDDRGPPGRSG